MIVERIGNKPNILYGEITAAFDGMEAIITNK